MNMRDEQKPDRLRPIVGMVLLGALAVLPATGQAQMRGGGGGMSAGPMPVGAPLDKIPLGTWAEYSLKAGSEPPRKLRQALVGKDAGSYVLETAAEGPRGKMITRYVVDADPTKTDGVKKVIRQVGDADPMEMPGGRAEGGGRGGGARFVKPDPKNLVGKETLKLTAGTFQTEHFREQGPRGGTVDFWIAPRDAGPFGLVKMALERPGGGDGEAVTKVTLELSARGKGAKPEITKPARPFDPEMMRGMWGRRGGDGGDGAGAGGRGGGARGGGGGGGGAAAGTGASPPKK